MQEKDLIKNLKDLKQIKPNQDWAFWLKSNLLETKPQSHSYKPKVKLAIFSFISKYQKVLIPSLMAFFFVFSFTFAQTTLPGSVLYPIKTLTQNAKIYLASENTKPVVRLEVAKVRMEDLGKVKNHEKEISVIAKDIGKDLEIVSQEIKNINNAQVALNTSRHIQEESKNLEELASNISLDDKGMEEFDKDVEDFKSEVFAYIIETTEEINQCPSSLENKLAGLEQYFSNTQDIFQNWKLDDIVQVRDWLEEASDFYRDGNCSEAMEKIESISKLLSIHSLEEN